uniref:SFRICE_013014 n=1 Tax=Spodoptera frugiperda TaxID=7108 RepID=A0A2H1VQ77_SPOFR
MAIFIIGRVASTLPNVCFETSFRSSIYKYIQNYSWVSRIPRFLPNLTLFDWTNRAEAVEGLS